MKTYNLVFGFLLALLVFSLKSSSVQAQSFTFGAAGDFANGGNFQATVNTAALQNPAFFLGLGDFSYSAGAEANWCSKWNSSFSKIALIVGNHDSGESSGGNISNYTTQCSYRPAGFTGSYGHQYYFDFPATSPTARFIMIRPGVTGTGPISYNINQAGYTFTRDAIDSARSAGIPWIIVGFHKNYISAMEKGNEIGTDLMKLLLDKKVDLILQGHEHGYERSKQLATNTTNCTTLTTGTFNAGCVVDSDNSLLKGAGSVIHILGTGGQGLRGLNTGDFEYPYFAAADNTTYGFGKFTVSPSQISYNFVRSAGGSFSDSFTIASAGATPSPVASPSPVPSPSPSPTPTPAPALPDLVVTNISWTPTNLVAPTPVTFSATVRNQGTGPTLGGIIHGVRFSIDGVLGPWSDYYTTSIPAGGTVTLTANGGPGGVGVWNSTAGSHSVAAEVDDVFRITESNETNNAFTKTFSVTAGTSPSPSPTPTPSPSAAPTPPPCGTIMPTNTGLAQTSIQITEGTSYKIWSRVNSTADSSNSFWMQVDDGCPINVGDKNGSPVNSWYWVDFKEGSDANKVVMPLSVGSHTIKLAGREPGLRLDKLIVISDLACVPTQYGDNCLAVLPSPIPTPILSPTPTPVPSPVPSLIPSPVPSPVTSPVPSEFPVPSTAVTFKPVADSYVDSSNTGVNKGTENQIRVDGSPAVNSYLRFDIQNIQSTITSATLRIFANSNQSLGFSVRGVADNNWQEGVINFTNAPAFSQTVTGSSGPVTGGNWYSVDVSSLARVNGFVSFALTTSNQTAISLASRESGGNAPQLIVNTGGSVISSLSQTSLLSSPVPSPSPAPIPIPTSVPTASTTTLTFSASDDATVKKDSANKNYGSSDELEVDQESFKDILMKFKVSGIGQKSIVGARLRLYAKDSSPHGGTFHKVNNNDWSEGAVTWDNAPQNEVAPFTELGKVSEGRWYEIDSSGLIGGDGTYSLKIHSTNDDGADYYSKEKGSEFAPQLVVVVK